jgi:Replication initiator protein, pSAM2
MLVSTALPDWLAPGSPAIEQAIRRAASPGYESWWARCASVGFCANPIQASAYDPDRRRRVPVLIRCGNRRAAICPSCSDLYAADTWQLIHAGTRGGHHGMPDTTADRPQVFATLTAPSFGAVHTSTSQPGTAGKACHPPKSGITHCLHGKPLWCNSVHRGEDPDIGQPLCPDCYDYTGHVLFNWHAPELWRRFTIALRRTLTRHLRSIGTDPNALRVSFVKVAEYQRRAVIHYHTLIRLDPTDDTTPGDHPEIVSAIELATLVRQAANHVQLPVTADETADTATTPPPGLLT